MAEELIADNSTSAKGITADSVAIDSARTQCGDLEKRSSDASASEDISLEGDAREDGYILIKNAIPKDIITQTEVDTSDSKVAKDGRRKHFLRGAPNEKIREHFRANVSKLIPLGLPKERTEMTPEIEFWEFLPDSRSSSTARWLAADENFVYVIIAMSEPLSVNEGLQEFVPGSHIPRTQTASGIFRTPTKQFTLHMGWGLAWTSELLYKFPPGGGGLYALLIYRKREPSLI
ncbi:hypothetical protein K469DRAFT_707084 [Zopfia rhizophila CBS 207.26]|uniref:Uncharacterized protein n=1 Tax=Zopfia rhizophila CBS 207.26 TaxID=1314779 RepID=A0A6A6D586_9PEZI|nr:hypothetical protein K469DRAFT_707084 [Zopfia rhizophila CBS 207.26]